MYKFMDIYRFAKVLFENDREARQASEILEAILAAQSPRISAIADKMKGKPEANYKRVHRFLGRVDVQSALRRLMNGAAEFVIGDPTEIERAAAKKSEYVGTLSDGETLGFWMMTLATPLRGRAIPCNFVTYSSRTLGDDSSSRNLEHQRALAPLRAALGERPIVLDREFSYLSLFASLAAEGVRYAIRLSQRAHPPRFYYDADKKQELRLWIGQDGKPKIYRGVYYMGEVLVNVIGVWRPGLRQPLWVITNLEPEAGLQLYQQRMKIEASFRDLKSLLRLDKIMNKSRFYLEQMIALVLIAYALAVLIGEAIRDVHLAGLAPVQIDLSISPQFANNSRWADFSGVFLLLRRRLLLPPPVLRKIVAKVYSIFSTLNLAQPVRSFV